MINFSSISRAAIVALLLLTACAPEDNRVQRITIVPTVMGAGAPVYTATASFTPSNTPTDTPTPTMTHTPTSTFTPTNTPTATATYTPTVTNTPPPSPTAGLLTPSMPAAPTGEPRRIARAGRTADSGWSCGDFPCAGDIDGFLQRISVPAGFNVTPYGRFPGQVHQITPGPDGRLYATVIENGTRTGRVFALAPDGSTEPISEPMLMPLGLAFQPGTDVLYVTSRLYDPEFDNERGVLWRLQSNGNAEIVIDNLPCCYLEIGNQPAGMTFGADGLLYVGVGALTDHGESPNPMGQAFADITPREAAILQINPHTGEQTPYAQGIRFPWDITMTSQGAFYVTDTGLVTGPGDRLLNVEEGGFYGFPFYRTRGCADCPPSRGGLDTLPDLLRFAPYSLPRGIVAYTGQQFPRNMYDTLFVALWNATESAQQIAWIDPDDPALNTEDYTPHPFMTGLIRPIDVTVAADGSLLVADYIYGHIWQVTFDPAAEIPVIEDSLTPEISFTEMAPFTPLGAFSTNTPAPENGNQ